MKKARAARLLGIVVLLTLFAGMIGYSARSVRYPVDGVPTSEFTVTNLSLTHSVERGADGKLTNPYAGESQRPADPNVQVARADTPKPAATASATKSTAKKELKARPASKKPTPKKLVPKKPAPRKPDPKKKPVLKNKPAPKKPAPKPSRARACPT